jgi:hypothetical protein
MNAHIKKTETRRHALAIDIWENEGGAPGPDSMDCHYGRRVEIDGSWTIYDVFTGIPADIVRRCVTGLTRSSATEGMLSLNLRNEERRGERSRLMASGSKNRDSDEVAL